MKNIDYIISKTANDLNIPKEKVKIVINEYWDSVYKKLITLNSTTIFIRDLGLITISKYKLRKFILTFIKKIRFLNTFPLYTKEQKDKMYPLYYKKLRAALHQRNVIAKEYAKKFGNI